MTRVTPLPRDLAKLTRSVGSTVAAPRSSQIFNSVSWSAAARVRKEIEHGGTDMPASERNLTTTHRPLPQPAPNPSRTIPLMQAFHTTPSTPAQADPSTIDYAFLPNLAAAPPPADPFFGRVPLLPDNFAPPRDALPTIFAPEAADEPAAPPEIVVVAADPDSVSAVSALTEVEGMGPDGVELSFAHDHARGTAASQERYAGGMLTGLWKGLVDEVSSAGAKVSPAL